MSAHQGLQQNRFELKYVIDPARLRAIRDYARTYLRLDENANPAFENAYPIHSIYLDGPGLPLANGTLDGLKNRFKLRIRYYDDKPDSPVFFEIKRRVNQAILKQRAPVRRDRAPRLIAGQWPDPGDLLNPANPRQYQALQQFCELRERLDARGRCIVSYYREAWVTPDNNSVRVTFDRNLVSTPYDGRIVCGDLNRAQPIDIGGVVLELKFTDRFPTWMRNMVHVFNLQSCSLPKYVECLCALEPARRVVTEVGVADVKELVARKDQRRREQGAPAFGVAGLGLAF
jgi:hypothetical protein